MMTKNSSQKLRLKEPVTFLFSKFWKLALNEKPIILLYIFLFTIASLMLLISPLIFGKIVREIQNNGLTYQNLHYLLFLLSLIFLKEIGFWVFHGPARVIERIAAFKIAQRYRKNLLDGVLGLDLSWHNEHDSGDIIDKMRKACESLSEFGENIFQVVFIVVRLISTAIVLYFFSEPIALLVFIMIVLSLGTFSLFDIKIMPITHAINQYSNKASASLFDALSNITTVKILHIEAPIASGVLKRYQDVFKDFSRSVKLNEWKWCIGILLFHIISVLPVGLYMIITLHQNKKIDAGTLSSLYLYISDLLFIYATFGGYYEMLYRFRNGVINVESLEEAISQKINLSRTKKTFSQKFELRQLNFHHQSAPNENYLFEHFNLTIHKFDKIAIIGESGGGKTTLLKVIHGMFPSATCQIYCDDQLLNDVNHLNQVDLNTMLVPQEPEIFSSTIRENITLGIRTTFDQIEKIIELSCLTNVINQLPQKLDSTINEKGVNLSGGERQRLALARALLFSENKEILLLDESTSSVDTENETQIYKNIFKQFNDKIVIASIHKLNLLKFFNRIIILDKGRIIDDGSFLELLERNDYLKKIWKDFGVD
jgi:ATP-binding cassette subfamily B protein